VYPPISGGNLWQTETGSVKQPARALLQAWVLLQTLHSWGESTESAGIDNTTDFGQVVFGVLADHCSAQSTYNQTTAHHAAPDDAGRILHIDSTLTFLEVREAKFVQWELHTFRCLYSATIAHPQRGQLSPQGILTHLARSIHQAPGGASSSLTLPCCGISAGSKPAESETITPFQQDRHPTAHPTAQLAAN